MKKPSHSIQFILVIYAISTIPTAQAQCPCPASYAPVCDAEGNRYDNELCAVNCEGANAADLVSCPDPLPPAGEPQEPCACTLDWQPMCDMNNILVGPNLCAAQCKGYTEEQLLDCLPIEPAGSPNDGPCPCTFDFRPVCDHQGFILAPNSCSADCMGYVPNQYRSCTGMLGEKMKAIGQRLNGKDESCVCTMEYDPVCDQYGVEAAPNPCTAACSNLTDTAPCSSFTPYQTRISPANPPKPQPCPCTMEYAPVCTEDGKQVGSNKCGAECLGYSDAQLSPCPVSPVTTASEDCICTREYFPQCLPNGTEVGDNPCVAACNGYAGQSLPCTLIEAAQPGAGPVTINPKPPCMCTKEYEPYCTVPTLEASISIPAGANKCNAMCNGYAEPEIMPCDRNAIIKQTTSKLCPCPLNEAPVCDAFGTELGANSCVAECKGYSSADFSEDYCVTPAVAPCEDTMCTMEYRPVCDARGTELASNACEAGCKGYNATDFSEEYCSFGHLIKNVTSEISSGDKACRCTKEYRPVCDSQGSVVAANPCTARCSDFNPPEYLPCFFIDIATNGTAGDIIQSVVDSVKSVDGEFANLVDSNIQTVCTSSQMDSLPMICAAYNASIGFPNDRGTPMDQPGGSTDSGAPSSSTTAALLLAALAVVGQRLL